MALAQVESAEQVAQITRLRAQIGQMQRRTASPDRLPVPAPLSGLFPSGGLRPGAAYALPDSPSLLLALAGEISRSGSWCAFVGMPDLSMQAAASHGVAADRVALIPSPGSRWLSAVSSAAEVFPLVAVRPPRGVGPAETARLDARLRDRGSTLLVMGAWPGAELSLSLGEPEWRGIGAGHGLIAARAVTIAAAGRPLPSSRRVRVLLPGPSGAVEEIATARRAHLRAVAA